MEKISSMNYSGRKQKMWVLGIPIVTVHKRSCNFKYIQYNACITQNIYVYVMDTQAAGSTKTHKKKNNEKEYSI